LFVSAPRGHIGVPKLKFLALASFNRSRDMEGSQNFKSMLRTPWRLPLTQFCILFVSAPRDLFPCQVSSFNRSCNMEGVPKISKVGHVTSFRPTFDLILQFVSAPRDIYACQIWSF